MCGLAFLWCQSGVGSANKSRFSEAVKHLKHRGPDEQSVTSIENALLGHVRLSIIDLAESHQPMSSPDQRYSLLFNGEIYNYQKVRETLSDRWAFRSSGDTEVLLAGLVLEGESFLRKLEGMWAFVLWDSHTETALLGRDRIGKKPLFFQCGDQRFSACSELPSLMRFSDHVEEDLDSISDYFRYGYFISGHTAFKGVKEVLPGHVMTCSKGVILKHTPYWELSISSYSGSKSNAAEDIYNTVDSAVRARLVSDVEVGSFLSGGVDSSIITSLARKHYGENLKTFTIGFSSKSYDERDYARQVSNYLVTDHYEEEVTEFRVEEIRSLIQNHVGQPFYDSSIMPTSRVSALASSKVKVALSGDGGDELFCGYQRYKSRKLTGIYGRLPLLVRNQVARMVRAMPEPTDHHSGSVLKKAHLFLSLFERLESERPYTAPRLLSKEQYDVAFPEFGSMGYSDHRLITDSKPSEIVAMMFNDVLTYLPQDIHAKVDRASMSHSLEARAPFMDTSVVELAFSLPLSWQLSPRTNKPMLHKAFEGIIPSEIWRRRKQGFAVPIAEWFKLSLGGELEGLIQEMQTSTSWLNTRFVENMLKDHRLGLRDNSQFLWQLYIYLIWKKSFFE